MRTDISEPRTDVTIVHDSFGRVIRSGVHSHPQAAAAAGTADTASSDPGEAASQGLSTHTASTLFDARNRPQDVAPRTLGAPFVDARATATAASTASSPSVVPRTPPSRGMFKVLSAELTGSPVRFPPTASARILSLSTSPRTSEGVSMQYEMTPPRSGFGSGSGSRIVSGSGGGDSAAKPVQKWRIHFAKPPKSATMASLAKPVTTEALVRNLELDEDAVRFNLLLESIFLPIVMRMRDHTNIIESFHRGVRSQNSALMKPRSDFFPLAVYLRSLQVLSGYTLATHHLDLPFCMTPYCLNLPKRRMSYSGVR